MSLVALIVIISIDLVIVTTTFIVINHIDLIVIW